MKPSRNPPRNAVAIFSRLICLLCPVLLAFSLAGCVRFPSSKPTAGVSSLQLTNSQTGPVSLDVLQQQIMRFADSYVATVAQACDDVTLATTNPAIRLIVLRWKLGQATSAYTDATGENPVVNALDMLVLTTMARMVIEDYGMQTYGDAIKPLLEAQCRMETNAWTLAGGVLKPSQVKGIEGLDCGVAGEKSQPALHRPDPFSRIRGRLGQDADEGELRFHQPFQPVVSGSAGRPRSHRCGH